MVRSRRHTPLRVLLNNRSVGVLAKEASGAIEFRYERSWLDWSHAFPVSLSLPLRADAWRGAPVAAVFENLLPDTPSLLTQVAERVGAEGTDAYSLLSAIGRDCVGALQFIPEDRELPESSTKIECAPIDEEAIEALLENLARAPLGMTKNDDFRISIAGAQEKTALLWHQGRWNKPLGTTPTTHILKKQIGQLPNGIDLSNSVENEFYCLKLAEGFGLPVNQAQILSFGDSKALVVERFDRRWTKDGRLIRLPQEDCCQALSIPPTRKYQNEGGPSVVDILKLLKGSDSPAQDQTTFLMAQILFWLIGATDGHGKNFSIFLHPNGGYALTPLYDILTAQPSLDSHQVNRKQMKLAMSVGNNRHYTMTEVMARHFVQSSERAGLPKGLAVDAIQIMCKQADAALAYVEKALPYDFPEEIHIAVSRCLRRRVQQLSTAV